MAEPAQCVLCREPGGQILVETTQWRVVLATEADALPFPGFTRVIWQPHIREMSALSGPDQITMMSLVFAVESLMIKHLQPDKINLASLGNMVDHLHWHVIPRWQQDSHFPRPIWAAPLPDRKPYALDPARLERYTQAVIEHFSAQAADHSSG